MQETQIRLMPGLERSHIPPEHLRPCTTTSEPALEPGNNDQSPCPGARSVQQEKPPLSATREKTAQE